MQLRTAVAITILTVLPFVTHPALAAESAGLEPSPGQPELDVETDLPIGPIILGGMSVAIIAVGAGFGWQADQEHDNWKEARDSGDAAATKRLADDVDSHALAANILLFGGTALLATSVIWWLLSGDDEEEVAGEARIQAAIGPGQAALYVTF